MQLTVLTIFPGMFSGLFSLGVLGRAVESGGVTARAIDIRDFTHDRHRTVDDRPFGGGAGMIMKPEPLTQAIASAKESCPGAPLVLLSPRGRAFDQAMAREFAEKDGLILACGRYEGVDERIFPLVDMEVSVGDFILSGGEPGAMVIMDAVARLCPGVLGNEESPRTESFEEGLLEYPHYTRPREFEGESVPEVLLSGDHKAIDVWREQASLLNTLARRPDLLEAKDLGSRQVSILKDWGQRIADILGAQAVRGASAPPGDEQAG